MLRRLARFVLYQMNPEETRAVRPASITFASTGTTALVPHGDVVDGDALELPYRPPRRVAGPHAALPVLYAEDLTDLPPEIQPARVAAALERLDPIDREILNYSIRRRVPDDALALLYQCPVLEFARRRTAAVERLSDELGVGSGGHLVKALLDPRSWAEPAPPRLRLLEPADSDPKGASALVPTSTGELVKWGGGALAKRASRELRTVPGRQLVRLKRGLARVGGRRLPAARIAAAGIATAAALGMTGLVVVAGFRGGEDRPAREAAGGPFSPRRATPLVAAFPSDPRDANAYPIAQLKRATLLYDGPGGRPGARIGRRTEWGSPRVLSVVRRRGAWLAVQAPELDNGEIAWLEADTAQLDAVSYSLHADLSRRTLTVRRDGHPVRSMPVAIGMDANPTPTGRFAVTDKLDVTDRSSPYGCCVLVLTGHQTRLPADWPGGDRLALHSTRDLESVGRAVSLGGMRTDFRQARWLMRAVPLGAPFFVRR